MSHTIPLIDLAPLRDGIEGARRLAPLLNRALEDVGFWSSSITMSRKT
ncbi:MAG: hypothetical protein VW709_04140 [Rickettsiales bacterium]